MSAASRPRTVTLRPMEEGNKATPFELFFDLVFVYAITQVTQLMAHEPTAHQVVRGMLVLGVLWWCWCGFTWLGNSVRLDEGIARAGLLVVMAAVFVISLAVPESFHDLTGGVSAPIVFVACYFVVRLVHQLLYMKVVAGDPAGRRQLALNWIPWTGGVAILLTAAFMHGWVQTLLWAAALAWDYGWVLLNGMSGWRVTSAAHFAERHGLIVIIAIGESIVAIGVGATGLALSWPIIVAAALAIGIASALWWAYFDVIAIHAEHRLTEATGLRRTILASHGYTYLHLPLVAGIVLLALGIEKVIQYAGGAEHHTLADPLRGVGLFALYGGVVVYLLGHVLFGRRMFGTWKATRIATIGVLVVAVPIAYLLPALGALGLLAAVLAGMVAYETVRYAEVRDSVRHTAEHQV